jgi:hypothetical protein
MGMHMLMGRAAGVEKAAGIARRHVRDASGRMSIGCFTAKVAAISSGVGRQPV